MSGSDRIQVLEVPVALPAKCGICGFAGSDGRTYVDFGLDVDWYGVVYFCSTCFQTAGNALGYCSPAQTLELKIQVEGLLDKSQRVEAENARLRAALDAIDFLPRSDISSSKAAKSEPKESDKNESGSSKSTAKSGPANIFEDDDIDGILGIK